MSDERGYTLIEILVAMVSMLVVLGAGMATLQAFEKNNRDAMTRVDSQQIARTSVEQLGRELRNLASPTYEQPQAVDKIGSYDIVFQTVDPKWAGSQENPSNVQRVRYCLEGSRLYRQDQRWTTASAPPVPSTASCPDSGWGGHTVAATELRNRHGGQERPAFLFDATTPADITRVRVHLFVDTEADRGVKETSLSTGVHLRNQNRPPAAGFTATVNGAHIILNAAVSKDPEGDPLTYVWFDGAVKIGDGITFDYVPPEDGSNTRYISLKVYDSAGLEGVAPTQTVTVIR